MHKTCFYIIYFLLFLTVRTYIFYLPLIPPEGENMKFTKRVFEPFVVAVSATLRDTSKVNEKRQVFGEFNTA